MRAILQPVRVRRTVVDFGCKILGYRKIECVNYRKVSVWKRFLYAYLFGGMALFFCAMRPVRNGLKIYSGLSTKLGVPGANVKRLCG